MLACAITTCVMPVDEELAKLVVPEVGRPDRVRPRCRVRDRAGGCIACQRLRRTPKDPVWSIEERDGAAVGARTDRRRVGHGLTDVGRIRR